MSTDNATINSGLVEESTDQGPGKRILNLMRSHRLTVPQTAVHLDVSHQTIRNILMVDVNGEIREKYIGQLAELFNTTRSYIRYGINPVLDHKKASSIDIVRQRLKSGSDANNALFNEALDLMRAIAWEYDIEEDRVTYIGKVMPVIDIPDEDLQRTFSSFLMLVASEDRVKLRQDIEKTITTGKDFKSQYKLYSMSSIKNQIIEFIGRAINTRRGIVGVYGVIRKI